MIIHSTVDSLQLFPEDNISRPEEILRKNTFTIGGRLAQFYEEKLDTKVNLDLTFMTTSDASLINQWWTDQTAITVVDDFLDVSSGSFFITNQGQPFRQLHRPYNNMWRGGLTLEQLK